MAQTDINQQNLDMLKKQLNIVSKSNLATLNAWLELGGYAVDHDLDSGEWISALKEAGGCPADLVWKSVQNNICAAMRFVNHFGSFDAASAAITARNESAVKDPNKRVSYSLDYLQNEMLPKAPKSASKPVKPSSNLAKAVKSGIITKAQADALAALGIK